VTAEPERATETAEELLEDAPCGYICTRVDGTIIRVNRTLESWTGIPRDRLLAGMRFQDLLPGGSRIYYETHYAPLLLMQGSVREIAVEIIRADGSRLPALINSVLRLEAGGESGVIRTAIFDATDRRRYEQELLRAKQREHDIAAQLQRSLLSGELPVSPQLALEISYSPAIRGLEVGGDWYDAFWVTEDEVVGLVVGDVVGRGVAAAATMGQLRSAVRALASTGLGPGATLRALDEYARRHHVGRMTTVVYAQLGLQTGSFRFACAGHPPPLVLPSNLDPFFAWEGRSTPLGVFGVADRAEACCTLDPGSTVLLYTDGLIERRLSTVDDGMSRLRAAILSGRRESLKRMVERLVRELPDAQHSDDVCLLAAHLTHSPPVSGSEGASAPATESPVAATPR
jgi:sigma-B regulation protein RsbU (phosphoserine phosphatase)